MMKRLGRRAFLTAAMVGCSTSHVDRRKDLEDGGPAMLGCGGFFFQPVPALPAGALLELDPNQELTYDENSWRVSAWGDRTAFNNNLAQSNESAKPLRVEIGSDVVCRFDTTASRIFRTTLTGGPRDDSAIVVLVARVARLGVDGYMCGDGVGSHSTYQIRVTAGGAWAIRQGGTVRSGGTADLDWHVLIAEFGATDILEVDGVQVVSADAGTSTADGVALGRSSSGCEMDVAAHVLFPAGTDRAAILAHYVPLRDRLRAAVS